MASSEDNFCLNCKCRGACCYYGAFVQGVFIRIDECCIHLDMETGLCKVFSNRFEVNPDCATVELMLKNKTLPIECKYVLNKVVYRKDKERRHYSFKLVNVR